MSSSLPLSGKTALITGGSRGLGRAMVERLASDGADVFFTYRSDAAAAQAVLDATAAAAGAVQALQADLSTVAGVAALFSALPEDTGLDVLVTNAGVIQSRPFAEVTEADFDRIFDLNVKGVFFTIQAALPRLRDGGRIVTIGTGLTRIVMPQYIAYSAAKDALGSLTRLLAQELGARGITVNTVAPGAIDTDMNPWLKTDAGIAQMSGMTALGRVGHADDVADVVAFLASADSRWVTAQRIEVSGGQHL